MSKDANNSYLQFGQDFRGKTVIGLGRSWGKAAFISIAATMAAVSNAPNAAAQTRVDAGSAQQIAVPPGPLGDSLFEIAEIYGVSVVGADALVIGKQAPEIRGVMTVEEALEALLAGSGLTVNRSSSGSYAISTSAPRTRRASAIADEIIVTGRAQRLYRVDATTTAKLPDDPLNTTQSITTINKDLIRDQGARDAQELYRNIAGVTEFSYAGVQARGFRQEEIFFDGLRGNPYLGFAIPQLYNIERVDFLKGPAGMLFGPGEPGGLFNYVTKKPSEEFSANVRGVYGTEARLGGSLEVTGGLPLDGTAGRLGVFVEDRNLPRRNADSFIGIYDGGFSADLPFALLTLQATYYEQDLGGNRLRGVPVDDNGDFLADRRWSQNEATDVQTLESTNLQALLDGEIGSDIEWNATLRWTDNRQEEAYHEPRAVIDSDSDGTPDLVGRDFISQSFDQEQLSFGANLIWTKTFGNFRNRFLAGYEHFDDDLFTTATGALFSQDVLDRFLNGTSLPTDVLPLRLQQPNYGQTQPENYVLPSFPANETDQRRRGVYALNELTLGDFTVIGGLRFDSFKDVTFNEEFKDENVSFRVGGLYKPWDNVSFFTQWADSFVPQSIFNQSEERGGPFEPTTGTIIEGGVKARLFDERFFVSLSAYDIKRQNVLQLSDFDAGMDGRNDFIAFGEVTSTGVELETIGDITPNWVFSAAYAYNDVRVTQDNGGGGIRNRVGDRFANAPEHQLGFWTRYQVPSINMAFAIGGDYVSERVSFSDQTVQSYFVADATIIWDNGDFDVLIRANNLFDKEYAVSGFLSRTGHFPGDPRSVFVEISRKW